MRKADRTWSKIFSIRSKSLASTRDIKEDRGQAIIKKINERTGKRNKEDIIGNLYSIFRS